MLHVESIYFKHTEGFEIQDVSFQLQQGKVLGLIGESGCGKSTLLDLVHGEYDLQKGVIKWNNQPIKGPSHQLISGHDDFKYVTQESDLMPYISVLDNIIKPLSRQHMEDNIRSAEKLLEVVDLSLFRDRMVKDLSGGQRQRVAIAKALVKTPKLILLDEPFSHIDNFLKQGIRRKLFKYLKEVGCSCIIATHDSNDILPFADEIAVLKQGKLTSKDSPVCLYNTSNDDYTTGLLAINNLLDGRLIDDKLKGHIVVYPHELQLIEANSGNVEVNDVYFHGAYYRVYFSWKGKEFVCDTSKKINFKLKYDLKINKEIILKRLSFNNC
jgi:ABC-type Fe3+/spermidine/putrescine transport system ATPase subunit